MVVPHRSQRAAETPCGNSQVHLSPSRRHWASPWGQGQTKMLACAWAKQDKATPGVPAQGLTPSVGYWVMAGVPRALGRDREACQYLQP